MRIALGVEYDGSAFSGWQIQIGVRTVQEELEKALSQVADTGIRTICAGRTDTGVHAIGQVVHIEMDVVRDDEAWMFGTNTHLPADIRVVWTKQVRDDFHARFSAVRRRYCYVIQNRPVRPGLLNKKVTWDYRKLDEKRMNEGAKYLLGEHDFSSYRSLNCQAKSPVRRIHRLDVSRHGEFIMINVEANAFLHHMVRNIAGVLMSIGAGECAPAWAKEVLEKRDRTSGGVTAKPHGLYLTGVSYPEEFDIPESKALAIIWADQASQPEVS